MNRSWQKINAKKTRQYKDSCENTEVEREQQHPCSINRKDRSNSYTTITEMADLPRILQKHSISWSRKILPPSKVKSLLAKNGKRYQVFHRQ